MSAHRNFSLCTITIVLAFAAAGCGGLLPKSEQQVITPQLQVAPDPTWPQVAWQLAIARPSANDMTDSRRMVVIPAPGQIQVYKGVSWDDTVPDIVQDSVTHAFQDSDRILAVGHQTSGLRTDFALQLDIREYQAVYHDSAGPPEVTLVINARLVDNSTSRAVASRTFRQAVPASGTSVPSVTHAFDTALSTFVHDLVGWTLVSGQQAHMATEAGASKH